MQRSGNLTRRKLHRGLERELQIPRRAEADAGQDMPGNALSSTEQRLQDYVRDRVGAEYSRLRVMLKADEAAATAADLEASDSNFKGMVTATASAMMARAADVPRLQAVADAGVQKANDDVARFRRVHLLDREARYHDPILGIGLLVLIFTLHALIDGLLFAEVTRWGLLGGALNAALLATPTIAMGVTLGLFGLRYLAHIRPALRTVGAIVSVLMGAGIVAWVFYVAHLRATAETAARAGREIEVLQAGVLSQIAGNPLAFLESWQATVLFVLAFLAAAGAVWDGYAGLTDPYPGYREVAEKLRRAEEAAATVTREFEEAVAAVAAEAIKRIELRRRGFDRAAKNVQRALISARAKVAASEAVIAAHTWAAAECWRTYRDLNARRRTPGTAPARFAAPLTFDIPAAGLDFDPAATRERLRTALMTAHQAADKAIADVRLLRARTVTLTLGRPVGADGARATAPATI